MKMKKYTKHCYMYFKICISSKAHIKLKRVRTDLRGSRKNSLGMRVVSGIKGKNKTLSPANNPRSQGEWLSP